MRVCGATPFAATEKDDDALTGCEAECRSLDAAAIAYIRKQRQFSGLV